MELKRRYMLANSRLPYLLIVPYGIETPDFFQCNQVGCILLIVPYGIETVVLQAELHPYFSFNRTLWN